MPARDRQHYTGSYDARAKAVRRAANADPLTTCWRCGRTLAAEQARTGKVVKWHAGHVIDGDSLSPLRAEHSTCNTSAGARMGNRRSMATSERWY